MISDNQTLFHEIGDLTNTLSISTKFFQCIKCEGMFNEGTIYNHVNHCNYQIEDNDAMLEDIDENINSLTKNTSSAENLSIHCPGCDKIFLRKDPHLKKCIDEKSKQWLEKGSIECSICKLMFKVSQINDHEVQCQVKYLEKENSKFVAILLNFTEYPNDWSKGMTDNLRMDELEKNSTEFQNLEKRFHISCPSYPVKKIERIQNKKLWDKYTREKNRVLGEKGSCKEHFLFHGCRTCEPEYIIKTGFDISFANDGGSFGRGNYFARLARYSCPGYCYVDKVTGDHYVFIAKVITGITHVASSGSGFKKPPFWDNDKKIYFDSCTNINNPEDDNNKDQMYIVYDNEKAYPYYMITYSTTVPVKK